MATNGPDAIRSAALLTAPTVSLLTAAQFVPEEDERWLAGIEFELDGVPTSHVRDACGTGLAKTLEGHGVARFEPYVLYTADACSTWGAARPGELRNRADRVLRRMAASESYVIEKELWQDSLGLGNPKIQDNSATVVTTAAAKPVTALALLEQAWADANHGAQGMVHMRPFAVVQLATNGTIRRVGNTWLTPMDNIVVAGRGYNGGAKDGAAPTAGSEWIYMTGVVQVRRSAIVEMNTPAEVVNRQTNDVAVYAERMALASFDPTLGRFVAQLDRTA